MAYNHPSNTTPTPSNRLSATNHSTTTTHNQFSNDTTTVPRNTASNIEILEMFNNLDNSLSNEPFFPFLEDLKIAAP